MADNFDVLGSTWAEELQPDGSTIDVQQVQIKATPSGVVFAVRIPVAALSDQAVVAAATPLADVFNGTAGIAQVMSITTLQETNTAGQLEDVVQATIRSTSGKSTSLVELPLTEVLRGRLPEAVGVLVAELDEIEAL